MLDISCRTMFHGRLDRPVEVDSDQMKTLIENNQHYTMWVIADILRIPKSIKLLVKMCLIFKENPLANPMYTRSILDVLFLWSCVFSSQLSRTGCFLRQGPCRCSAFSRTLLRAPHSSTSAMFFTMDCMEPYCLVSPSTS